MALSLFDVVVAACSSAPGREYMARPDEAPSFGQELLAAFGAEGERLIELHENLLLARDLQALTIFRWAKTEAHSRALEGQPGALLHMGITWATLAEASPRRYWPRDRELPDGIGREMWSELLFWAHAFTNDPLKTTEWTLCIAGGAACAIEVRERLKEHPKSHEVLRIVHNNDRDALRALVKRAESYCRKQVGGNQNHQGRGEVDSKRESWQARRQGLVRRELGNHRSR